MRSAEELVQMVTGYDYDTRLAVIKSIQAEALAEGRRQMAEEAVKVAEVHGQYGLAVVMRNLGAAKPGGDVCPACEGSGWLPGPEDHTEVVCRECSGKGEEPAPPAGKEEP